MNSVAIFAGSGTSRSTITATVGFMCIGLSGWMLSMTNASWFGAVFPRGAALLMPLSIVLAIMGILAFIDQRTLDAVIFFGAAGLFWSDQMFLMATSAGGAPGPARYNGWAAVIWAVYFFYLWLGSFRAGVLRMLFLLGMWLTLLALAIAAWGLPPVHYAGGYIGLATALLAVIISASSIIGHADHLPAEVHRPV